MASWTDFIGPVVGAVIGGTQGNRGGETTNTATKALDPRLANYVFGQNGNGGLLADASSIYQQQMAQGGLNDMQRQGLDMQAQYLQSPQYTNSYQAMMNQGMGLLNAPIAGNPFTRSQGGQGGAPSGGGYQYRPSQVQAPIYRPAAPLTTLPMQIASPASQVGGDNTGQGGGIVSGQGGGSYGGQGINNSVTSAALAAMAASENPAVRALSPSIAALLGVGGYGIAGMQVDAMGAAGNYLSASQPLSAYGIGTISDMDGNVRTFSSPDSIAAADRAMFGGGGGGSGNPGFGDVGNSSFGEGEY